MSLRIKIILLFLLSALIGAVYVFQYWMPKTEEASVQALIDATRREMGTVTQMLISPMLQNQVALIYENMSALLDTHPHWVSLELIDEDGHRLFPISDPPDKDKVSQKVLQLDIIFRDFSMGKLTLIVDFESDIKAIEGRNIQLVSALFAGYLIILLVIVVVIDTFVSRPVNRVSRAAEHLANGDFDTELPLNNSRDEVGSLVRGFAAMRLAIRQGQEQIAFQQTALDEHAIVSMTDVKGNITFANDKFCDISGYSRGELLGQNHRILRSDEHSPAFYADFWKTISNGKVWHGEVKNKAKDGESYWVKATVVPFLNEQGEPFQYIAIRTDITEQVRAKRNLEKARAVADEANQAKSEFLSSMSHELRTPMNAILGFGQMLEFNPDEPLTAEQKDCVDHIMSGGNHLLELIDQVLDLAKIESGKLNMYLEEVRLDDIFRECLALIENSAMDQDISIDINLAAANNIKADYTRFKQVLLNILSNAIKYNRKGGSVALATKEIPGDMIRISVTDTGEGIAEEDQAGLFEPFNRLGKEAGEVEGTGIGLTITKQLVEAMNGHINYESEVGKGSTFWVEFPAIERTAIKQAEQDEVSEKDEHIEKTFTAATVLYIEDNPANLRLMETIIGRIDGISMISAHTAELGLTMAEEQIPNLILMDINLPGMDGIAAMKVLSTVDKTKDIPVVAISAAAMKSDIKKGMAAGFKAYLTKPFNVPELIRTIKEILERV